MKITPLQKEQERLKKVFDGTVHELGLKKNLSSEFIIELVYVAGERWGDKAHLNFQKEISQKLSRVKDQNKVFKIIELAFAFWNHFPHKDMANKTPFELIQETNRQTPLSLPSEPKVIVGNHEMTMNNYQAMLEEMEKAQEPFRHWLQDKVIPAYAKFLQSTYKPTTIKKHASVADILCSRMLMLGFVSPEHVRPDFLFTEFPVWWQTHVMFGNYTETAVENSVIEFLNFIEGTYGVVLDDEYIKSDPHLWD